MTCIKFKLVASWIGWYIHWSIIWRTHELIPLKWFTLIKLSFAVQALVELQLQAGVTVVGFPLFLGDQFLSHGSSGCVPYVLPGVPPVGAALSASPASRSSRHVKDAGFTHQKWGRPPPPSLCDVCGGLDSFFSLCCLISWKDLPQPLCVRLLPFSGTCLKRREGSRCQEGTVSILWAPAFCSNEKKCALCPCENMYLTLTYMGGKDPRKKNWKGIPPTFHFTSSLFCVAGCADKCLECHTHMYTLSAGAWLVGCRKRCLLPGRIRWSTESLRSRQEMEWG